MQLDGDFVGEFATHFAAAKWALKAAKRHTCAWRVIRSCENFRNLELEHAKLCFGDFTTHFVATKWALKAAK